MLNNIRSQALSLALYHVGNRLQDLAAYSQTSSSSFQHVQSDINYERKKRNDAYAKYKSSDFKTENSTRNNYATNNRVWYGNGSKLNELFNALREKPVSFDIRGRCDCLWRYTTGEIKLLVSHASAQYDVVLNREDCTITLIIDSANTGVNVDFSTHIWYVHYQFPWSYAEIVWFMKGERLEHIARRLIESQPINLVFTDLTPSATKTEKYTWRSTKESIKMKFGDINIEYEALNRILRVRNSKSNSILTYAYLHPGNYYCVGEGFPWLLSEIMDFIRKKNLNSFITSFLNMKTPPPLFAVYEDKCFRNNAPSICYKSHIPEYTLRDDGRGVTHITCSLYSETAIEVHMENENGYKCSLVYEPECVVVKHGTNGLPCISANDVAEIIKGTSEVSMRRIFAQLTRAMPMEKEILERSNVKTNKIANIRKSFAKTSQNTN